MKKKIMVVDDSRFIFEEIKYFLTDSDYEIVAYCKDGEEAVARYGECQPDVVTMDIILPGIDGLEAASQILTKYTEARIVMVSSLAYDDTMERSEEIGAKQFLFKPIEKKQLLEALANALIS